jgi:phosphopantetheinyl transferase (holo-ACP synthase)
VAGAEIMAELAQMLVPNWHIVAMLDLQSRRTVQFRGGKLTLFVRAERIASTDPGQVAVKGQLREDSPNSAWTWPVMEGTFALAEAEPHPTAFTPPPMARPRDVHWTASDIYPDRLCSGELLRHIRMADRWSETGLDYEVEVPSPVGAVAHTRFPVWVLNPQLLAAVVDGFALWRSHERFPGAFSFAFRVRQLTLHSRSLPVGTRLHCYLRYAGATPRSLITDVLVSDGNGTLVMELRGYEELTERVPDEYRQLLLAPATTFLTKEIPEDRLGAPATAVSSAMFADVPYPLFERNEKLWLRTVSHVVLAKSERREFETMTGGTARRTEWLFGRIAAKEAVRRFLNANYQARWSDADVEIYRDDSGKPHPIGKWNDLLSTKIDLAIAHTAQFVVAVVAANARVGVDVEARDRDLSDEFTRGVFTPEEQELATQVADAPSAILRLWCAKESVSKALGTGIRYSPKELVVESFQPDTGEMDVRLEGQWLENFKMFTGRTVRVSSSILRGHVLASCFIPASLFG